MAIIFIELPVVWIISLDILAWFMIHMAISLAMMRVPDDYYRRPHRCFESFEWEKKGRIWQDIFRIRAWKNYLPDSSSFIKNAYDLTNLNGLDLNSMEKIILETKRAEHTHWLSIPPALLFYIWNPPWAGIIMIIYALLMNLPFIIVQRYNRPRLIRVYKRIEHK